MQPIKILFSLVIFSFLSSCTLFEPSAPGTATGVYNAELAKAKKPNNLSHWTINGRIAIITPTQSQNASVYWRQQRSDYTMQFIAPLGTGAVRLSGSRNRVTLVNAQGKSFSAKSAENLLEQQLGWRIPVANLFYWIRGIPAPNIPANKQYDKNGDLASLRQQGWKISYLSYAKFGEYSLPTRIFLNYGKLKLRLIITRWQL
ncbi:MAG: lipoprotein insertase outer membrane protein LolB [Pseudomonadota bacterium]